jgi:hypothetical protein
MIPKSGDQFSDKIMLKQKSDSMIPKSGNRFPACEASFGGRRQVG